MSSLMGNKQVQEVGNNSSAIQVHGDYKAGLSYRDVKDLCVDLIQANFPILQEQAKIQSMQYVEEFASKFFNKIKDQDYDNTQTRLKNPDVQASINSSIMHVARMTDKSHQDILCELLAEKIKEQEDEKNILLNDAIDVMTKISKNQIKFLTFINLIRKVYKVIDYGDRQEIHPDPQIQFDYFENEIPQIIGNDIYKIDTFLLAHKGLIIGNSLEHYTTSSTALLKSRTQLDIPEYESEQKIEENDNLNTQFPKFTKIIKSFGFDTIDQFDHCVITSIGYEIAQAHLKNSKIIP